MIDGQKINKWIEAAKKKKPDFLQVDQAQWEESLDGYCETFSNAVNEKTTTDQYWSLIYFSAVAFCKGMDYADIKAGKKQDNFYPRY